MSGAATADDHDLLDQVPSLLSHLRAYQYRLSTVDELRVLTLRRELQQRGACAPNLTTLAQLIGPVVCRDPDEQDRLPDILQRWDVAKTLSHPKKANPAGSSVGEISEYDVQPRSRYLTWLFVAVVATGLLLMFLTRGYWLNASPGLKETLPVANPTAAAVGRGTISTYYLWLALVPIVAIIAFEAFRRRASALKRGAAPRDASALALQIAISDSPMFRPGAIQSALSDLRRHRQIKSTELDISRSVAATVRYAGFVQLVPGRRFVTPDYVLLNDRASGRDHFGELGSILAARLNIEQVRVTRAEYFGDPRRLRMIGSNGERRLIALDRLIERCPDARLLIFADTADFWDSVHNRWRSWVKSLTAFDSVSVLTPRPRSAWGPRERELVAQGFLLAPATSSGIMDLARQFRLEHLAVADRAETSRTPQLDTLLNTVEYRWPGDASPPAEVVAELVEELRRALDPGAFLHLCAIAVFPVINPRLTEQVGVLLPRANLAPAFDEAGYITMSRLPWLRKARMPDWLRKALLEALPTDDALRVRSLWTALLLEDPPNTARGVTLDVVDPAQLRGKVGRLLRALRKSNGSALSERLLLAFLAGQKLPDLSVAAPERIASRLTSRARRRGIALASFFKVGTVLRRSTEWLSARIGKGAEAARRTGAAALLQPIKVFRWCRVLWERARQTGLTETALIAVLTPSYQWNDRSLDVSVFLIPLVLALARTRPWQQVRRMVAVGALPLLVNSSIGLNPVAWRVLSISGIGLYILLLMLPRFVGDARYRERCLSADNLPFEHALFLVFVLGAVYQFRLVGETMLIWSMTPLSVAMFLLVGISRVPIGRLLLVLGAGVALATALQRPEIFFVQSFYFLPAPSLATVLPLLAALVAGRVIREQRFSRAFTIIAVGAPISTWLLFPVYLVLSLGQRKDSILLRLLLPILAVAIIVLDALRQSGVFDTYALLGLGLERNQDPHILLRILAPAIAAWLTAEIILRAREGDASKRNDTLDAPA